MTFNQFSLYAYAANEFVHACDDKILVELQQLKNLTEYDDVLDFVNKRIGSIKENTNKTYEYPNEIKVIVITEPNSIKVAAIQNNKQIFGRQWRIEPENND